MWIMFSREFVLWGIKTIEWSMRKVCSSLNLFLVSVNKIYLSKNHNSDQRGSALIAVIAISVISMIIGVSLYKITGYTTKQSGVRKNVSCALNLADAGKEDLYSAYRRDELNLVANRWEDIFTEKELNKGKYSVDCSTNTQMDTIWVKSKGECFQEIRRIRVVAKVDCPFPLPRPGVLAAITARGSVELSGTIDVDGRDWDSTGARVLGGGVFGISTESYVTGFSNSNSKIGGHGIDLTRGKNCPENIKSQLYQERATADTALQSVEKFLGVAPGFLQDYYVTSLSAPFNGIYHIESDLRLNSNSDCSGILIVHNATGNATLSMNGNMKFTGLIIADRLDKINGGAEVVGAVVVLSPFGQTVDGGGTSGVKYSSQVLRNLDDYCDNLALKLTELEWREE